VIPELHQSVKEAITDTIELPPQFFSRNVALLLFASSPNVSDNAV
jgi:hypothetical protein